MAKIDKLVNAILFFILIYLLSYTISPIASQQLLVFLEDSFTVDNLIIHVYEDGSCLVEYYLSVEDYPVDIEFRILGKPVYIEAYSDTTPIPVESINEIIRFTALSSKVVIKYYTLDLTNKTGYNWRFHIVSQYRVKVVMPTEAMVYSISPEDFDIGLVDNEPAFIFDPGEITIEYILVPVPSQETIASGTTTLPPIETTNTPISPNTGSYRTTSSPTKEAPSYNNTIFNYIIPATIIAVATIIMYILLKKKHSLSESTIEKLDEIDKTILETLKRHGELTAKELLEKTRIPRSTLYRRLSKLKEQGFIEAKTKAGITYYRIK